ncbi:MAG: helix-turn-helix transcriptional regulator [Oscillospiraceae bacterium]|nr:helix-turn-helix transcriptional regulator [Oscillospiraceae bacterium]
MTDNNNNNLKEARKLAGLTQKGMSEQLGIPRRTIEDWERGISTPQKYVEQLVIEKLLNIASTQKGDNDDIEIKD